MPLAAMEASGPIPQQPTETAVVQIETAATTTVQTTAQTHKAKQHTATASTFQPWKRALEYYRLGQYQDMAGEVSATLVMGFIGFISIAVVAVGLYSLYSYFTHLTPFGEALTGHVSHTPASGYHQLTAPEPQHHDVMKTAWNMMASHNNLTKTLFAAAGLYLQGGDISSDTWRLIQTGTKPLQGAFQYLPKDVQSVFFQLCFAPKGHLVSLANYPVPSPEWITDQHYHDVCDPSHIDVRLAVQRPLARSKANRGKSDAPHIAAFTHLSKTHQQLGHPSTQRMLLQNDEKPYAATVDHLLHNTTGLVQTAFSNTMKLRADLCPGNISFTLKEQMQSLQSIMAHTTQDYVFFYLWFNTAGNLARCDYDFSDDLEDFNAHDCDFNTTVDFKNDAHMRIAIDRTGSIVTTARKNDLLQITPTVPITTPVPETPVPTPQPTPVPTDPCGVVDATQFVLNTTEGIQAQLNITGANSDVDADHLISFFNVTNTPAAQVNHVLGQLYDFLIVNAISNPDARKIVPVYNNLVAHFTNATHADSNCFADARLYNSTVTNQTFPFKKTGSGFYVGVRCYGVSKWFVDYPCFLEEAYLWYVRPVTFQVRSITKRNYNSILPERLESDRETVGFSIALFSNGTTDCKGIQVDSQQGCTSFDYKKWTYQM